MRRWAPVLGAWALAVAGIVVLMSRYDVAGHAMEHLVLGGWMGFSGAAVVFTIVWSTRNVLRQPEMLVLLALWLGAAVMVQIGNVGVVQDYIDAGMRDVPEELATVADHGLANAAPAWAVVASFGVVLASWRRRLVTGRTALVAAVLNVVVVPWVFAGFGVAVVMLARLRAFSRQAEVVPGEGQQVVADGLVVDVGDEGAAG